MKELSPCGFNCSACEAYIATQRNDLEILSKHQKSFEEHFGQKISLEELKCEGCMSPSNKKISFCAECDIRRCAINRMMPNCAYCPDFPCAKGKEIWQEGSESLRSLLDLRRSLAKQPGDL
nr:hypothetical protein [Candidatus Cloacimonadota bacterium]